MCMKSKGVTTQMKALDEYFLMVVLTLLLKRVHVYAIFVLVQKLIFLCREKKQTNREPGEKPLESD